MTHPIVPQVIDLATPVAAALGLDVVGAVLQTNQRPPILRIDIRHPDQDTSLEHCEQMSRAIEPTLDASGLLPDAYILEVSSPGISRILTSDREFISFKGFAVLLFTSEPYEGQQQFTGRLVGRDPTHITLSQKGRILPIPRSLVTKVQLDERRGA